MPGTSLPKLLHRSGHPQLMARKDPCVLGHTGASATLSPQDPGMLWRWRQHFSNQHLLRARRGQTVSRPTGPCLPPTGPDNPPVQQVVRACALPHSTTQQASTSSTTARGRGWGGELLRCAAPPAPHRMPPLDQGGCCVSCLSVALHLHGSKSRRCAWLVQCWCGGWCGGWWMVVSGLGCWVHAHL